MKNGIYIRPGVVRLVLLAAAASFLVFMRGQMPEIRRYIKFETM